MKEHYTFAMQMQSKRFTKSKEVFNNFYSKQDQDSKDAPDKRRNSKKYKTTIEKIDCF